MRIGRRQNTDAPHTASGLPRDDAAECYRAEENLQVAYSTLAEAQALAHLGSWEYDFSTNQLIWSDEVYRIFGVDRAKFVPSYEALVARIHPDDRAAFEEDYADSVANHRIHDIEHRILLDGGTPKYVHERGCTFYDADGRPLRSVGTVQDISERKKSEASLKRSEMLLANALALNRAAPWEYDIASNLFTFNDMFYAMLGTTAEQVGGYQMSAAEYAKRYVYPDDIPVVAGETQIAIETSDPNYNRELEHRFFYANGETGILSVRIRVLQDESGRTIKTYGVNQDVTKLRRMERELTLSKALSATAVECSVDAILIVDTNKNVILHNRVFLEMWRLPKRLLEWRGDDALLKFVASQVKDPQSFVERVEYLYKHPGETARDKLELKDGRILDRDCVSLYDDNGKYLARAWFFRDITGRMHAEQALRESEENFRAIFASVREGIFVVDPETGKFVEVNPAGCQMFGYSRDEIVGSGIGMLSSGEAPYTQEDALKRIHNTSAAKEFDWCCKTRDGRRFWAALSVQTATFRGKPLLLATARDITERKKADAIILRMARYDLLTGLANRVVFVDALQQEMASARRGGKGFAVLYLDLDHFKDVNDTLGHPIGDLLLQTVAERLQAIIRETDTVARFGGDEFAVIAADIQEPAEAALLADKILKVISDPFSIQGNEIRSGTSIGIAVYGPDSPDAETLLSHADEALYRAKLADRGTYRFFTESMDNEVRSRVMLKAELRIAIESDQLVLMYQPQVNIDTNRIIGLEALVRWQHPKRGLVMPGEFIPAAEKSGLIVALGRWVLQQACRQMKEWLDAGIAPPLIAVNVSGLQFKMPLELENDIRIILSEAALPPNLLELEITESIFMEASQEHNDVLARLQKTGIRIAIDDFGTGYSSLSYLGRFPVNRIKIEQNFMLDLTATSPTAKIVKAAIRLAHELELDVIVEGVETSDQVELLRSWDCHKVQGFYFSKPLPAREIATLLRARKILPTQPVAARVAV